LFILTSLVFVVLDNQHSMLTHPLQSQGSWEFVPNFAVVNLTVNQ